MHTIFRLPFFVFSGASMQPRKVISFFFLFLVRDSKLSPRDQSSGAPIAGAKKCTKRWPEEYVVVGEVISSEQLGFLPTRKRLGSFVPLLLTNSVFCFFCFFK